MPKIFISYRRDDNKEFANNIHRKLIEAFGEDKVFLDSQINAGAKWQEVIKSRLDESNVLLVVMGSNWERIMQQRSSWYRSILQQINSNERDWVRYEIEQGLERENKIALVPVLIEDTKLPDNLPKSIQKLKNYQTFRVRGDYDFEPHMDRLVKVLEKYPDISSNPAAIPLAATSAQTPEHGLGSRLNLPIITISIFIIIALIISAFMFLPTLIGNSPRETQLADNPAATEAATENTSNIVQNTDAPTEEATSSDTVIATHTSNPTNQPTLSIPPSPEPTLSEHELQIEDAWNFSGRLNGEWRPYIHTFEDGVEMALVPVGCFQLGNDPNGIRFPDDPFAGEVEGIPDGGNICFDKPFWIDETEVTLADFERLGDNQEHSNFYAGNNVPVESITWFEARDYCSRVGKRLPTEVEWEYAARGVENWFFPWGNSFEAQNLLYGANSGGRTASVGSYENGASWVGALDMSGSVFEWMGNLYSNQNELDLINELDHRPLRGGSWGTNNEDRLRASSRSRARPDNYADDSVGFRCVRDID